MSTATAVAERPQLAPARTKEKSILDYLRDPKVIKSLDSVATKYLTAERMTRLVINAVSRTPKLAACTPQSILGSVMFSTAIGLEPNTILQHAYLIPRDNRRKIGNEWKTVTECQFMPGYRGYVVMAKRNPLLIKITASVIRAHDEFDYQEGSETFLKFKRALSDPGEAIGAFCFTKEKGNFGEVDMATVLPWEEIEKIRSRSETWKFLTAAANDPEKNQRDQAKAQQKLEETPWVMWEGEMAAKSAIRRHIKQLDLTHGLSVVAEMDAAGDIGVIDMAALADPEQAKAVAEGEAPAPMVERGSDEAVPDMAAPRAANAPAAAPKPAPQAEAPRQQPTPRPAPAPAEQDEDVEAFN